MASLLHLSAKPSLPAKTLAQTYHHHHLSVFSSANSVQFAGFGSGKRRSVSPIVMAATGAAERRGVSPEEKREEEPMQNSKPIIVIDNYDSFTYNLCQGCQDTYPCPTLTESEQYSLKQDVFMTLKDMNMAPTFGVSVLLRKQYMGELGANFEVYRNDEITVEEVKRKCPRGILVSPGPGAPRDSGISLQTVVELGPSIPLFGVCMGLQCIGEAFGGNIVRAPSGVMHGKGTLVHYNESQEDSLFCGLSNPFIAGRYHSFVIENDSFPSDALEITAWTEDGLIMAARHKKYRHILGVQFHPESIITKEGKTMIANFLKLVEKFGGGEK